MHPGEDPLLQKTPRWKGPMTQGNRPINGFSRSLVLVTIRFRLLLQLCFTCLISQPQLSLQVVLPGFQAAHVVAACSKPLHKATVISCALSKPTFLLNNIK